MSGDAIHTLWRKHSCLQRLHSWRRLEFVHLCVPMSGDAMYRGRMFMSSFTFDAKLTPAPGVLIRTIEGESLVLSIPSQEYFGLDPVGTRMWELVTTKETIEEAYRSLLGEFDVAPEVLRQDLTDFLQQLLDSGLLMVDGRA